ncbi:MAG: Ig-like domain-containing protein [Patescibacteria group bacterium]|nr:Ig-like domain-containing protein [Patescibacteria group bacterium]
MKNENRIPTLVGLFLIGISLTATVVLFKNAQTLFTQASPDYAPSDVKITNVNESSLTVSWVTTNTASGSLNFGETPSLGSVISDDRDQVSGKTSQFATHYITLRYLKPGTQYYFKIISGNKTYDRDGEAYIVTTAPEIPAAQNQSSPIYGTVIKNDGTPAEGAIVYLNINKTTPLSTLVKTSGSWLLPLNNTRSADLLSLAEIKENDKIDIFVQDGNEGSAKAKAKILVGNPLPQITLGKTSDFTQEKALPSTSPTTETFPDLNSSVGSPSATSTPPASLIPALTTPATESAIPSDKPLISGTGIPGKTVTIKIESEAPITGTTKISENGSWTWTPPTGLTPGEHTVTITTADKTGKLLTFVRKFTVLASGTQVVEAATPSATPKTSPTPTPKPTPTATPKKTASPSPTATPKSGNSLPTILISLLGVGMILLGGSQILWLDRKH